MPEDSEHAPLIVDVHDADFSRIVLQATLPVLVYFWAPWCTHCMATWPLVDGLASQFQDDLRVVRIDVDKNPRTPSQCQVRGIPQFVFFRNGQVVEQLLGAVEAPQLVAAVGRLLRSRARHRLRLLPGPSLRAPTDG